MLEDIKYRQVEQCLLRELQGPAYKVSDKLESENALVKKFGVSKITIRKALERLEQDGIILCEHGKRRVLLRKPVAAGKIRSGMSFGLFMLGEYLTANNDLLDIARNLADGLHAWNADLVLLPIARDVSELEAVKRAVGRNMIDGLFLTDMREGAAIVDYMQGRHFPCVYFSFMDHVVAHARRMPFVGLRERAVLGGFSGQFRTVWVVGTPGDAMERTRSLLEPSLPVRVCQATGADAEAMLTERLSALGEDEALILASMQLIPVLDMVARRMRKRNFSRNVLIFRHHAMDLSAYAGRYLVFDRPVSRLGMQAASRMREVILSGPGEPDEAVMKPEMLEASIHLL